MSPATPSSRSGEGVNTQAVTFSVTLPDNHAYDVAGVLYWQGQLEGKVLQIAQHGGSYNHRYWDADDLDGHPYSYARYMARHGFAVLALDHLGAGASSRPDGDLVTVPVEALAVHQIIQGLGSAPIAHRFRKIVLVGHSLGSLESIFLQGTYHDADALVVTGWANAPHVLAGSADAFNPFLGEPHVIIPAPFRAMTLYAGNFAPAMPDYDNANLRDATPRGAVVYGLQASAGKARTESQDVTGPVLLVFGELDGSMPLPYVAAEPATYPKASSVTTQVVPNTGHALNLHLANVEVWAKIEAWIRENVGGGD